MAGGTKPPQREDDQIFSVRLITHAGASTNKKDPPLTTALKKYVQLCKEASHGTPESTIEHCQAFLQELPPIEIAAIKLQGVITAQQQDKESFASRQQELESMVQQAKADIRQKKLDLEAAKIKRQHLEEYEVIRALIAEETPRHSSYEKIRAVQKEIAAIDVDAARLDEIMERRKKQFALLFHCIEDLQRLQDDQDVEPVLDGVADGEVQPMQVG